MAARRIQRDLNKIRKYGVRGIAEAEPVGDNLFKWEVTMHGPKESPYEGGQFKLAVDFPPNYPLGPPTVSFNTPVYHPSVQKETGKICTDLISDEWKPTRDIKWVVEKIQAVLQDPSSDSPLEKDIAWQYEKDPLKFHKKAREWTKIYAKGK
mmetsp:Transcript_20147/g.24429  ORF Transcript_20147/g.24429 Transcript_20147/m.24429 type:complete len:152 (-) Transcript_20147:436-891(-)